jgi:hypothetical protein
LAEGGDRLSHSRESVAPGWREVTGDAQRIEWFECARGYVGYWCTAEKIADANDETAHDRGFRVAAKIAAALADFADEPHHRHAAAHAVRIHAFVRGEWRYPFRTINDDSEALLRVIHHAEVVNESLQSVGEEHPKRVIVDYGTASIARTHFEAELDASLLGADPPWLKMS